MQTIYLDISNKGVIPCIQAKQNEVGRKFLAVITDSGIPYEIQSDSVISVWYEGASGKGNYTEIGERLAISATKNRITVELIAQMLAVPGNGVITVLINSANGDQIGLWNIDYCVESVAGIESEKAEEYYTAFSKSAASLAESAETIGKTQERIDSIIKAKNAPAAGLIYPIASDKIPSGFLLCNGAEYSRVDYSELFEAIGTTYGVGDGNTTFNVPNLSARVLVGSSENYPLGKMDGEERVTLDVSEIPSHTHYDGTSVDPSAGGDLLEHTQGSSPQTARVYFDPEGDVAASGSIRPTSETGGDQSHNNMQPYTVVNYIISTGKEVELIVGRTGEGGGYENEDLVFTGAVSAVYNGSETVVIDIPTVAGEPGYTPVRGTDYWTDEDKAVIVAEVLAALPAAEGVAF